MGIFLLSDMVTHEWGKKKQSKKKKKKHTEKLDHQVKCIKYEHGLSKKKVI